MRGHAIAWAVTLLTLAMFAAFGVLFYTPFTPPVVFTAAGGTLTSLFVFPAAGFALVGALIAIRRPGHPIGWVMVLSMTAYMVGVLCSLIGSDLAYGNSPAAPWVLLGSALWNGPVVATHGGLVLLLLLFPDGRLPSRRWRVLIAVEAVLVVCSIVLAVIDPQVGALGIGASNDPAVQARLSRVSPLAVAAVAPSLGTIATVLSILSIATAVAAVVSVFLRLRGADAERRHQIRWFSLGALISVVLLVFATNVPNSLFIGYSTALLLTVGPAVTIAFLALPVAIAVAVLRYRLYDIDIVISRTLVYGSLAIFITAVYVGIAVGIGTVAGSGGKPNLGLSILATAIVAAGFQPVRARMQRVANRLVYGKRATPYEVLSEFSGRVAGTYAGDEVLPRMATVLQQGSGAESATVWLRSGDDLRPVATHPLASAASQTVQISNGSLPVLPGTTHAVAVRYRDELLGALSVSKRRGEGLTPIEQRLVDDLAHQAGLVLSNVRLTADLQARIGELRSSRQRLVTAQDDERRRLERDLHDGAQQNLVALKVKLGLMQALGLQHPEQATRAIQELKDEADEALETLRSLARGIYPPLLADKGLVAALEAQARKATVAVHVHADSVERYPQDQEATVYFCVLEALQNAQKYADAAHVDINLSASDARLQFEVRDDGRGFDPVNVVRGAGLSNMHDRIDAVGGTLDVTSEPGRGTRVSGSLPVSQTSSVS